MRDVWWSELHRVNKFSPRVFFVDCKGRMVSMGRRCVLLPSMGRGNGEERTALVHGPNCSTWGVNSLITVTRKF